jgi:hypothetical protein
MAIPLNYSEHAALNLIDRKIEPSWVEKTIEFPELIKEHTSDVELDHRFKKIDEKGNRVLHVVFKRNERTVITAYFDRNMKGKL